MNLRLRTTARADEDIDAALATFDRRAAAFGFVDELERVFDALRAHPEIGSARFAAELEIEGLRSMALGTYPYQAFYFIEQDTVLVVRVLHTRRDTQVQFSSIE